MALQRRQLPSLQSLSGSRSPGSAWQDSPEVGLGGMAPYDMKDCWDGTVLHRDLTGFWPIKPPGFCLQVQS